MLKRVGLLIATVAALPLLAGAVRAQQTPPDVKPDHWAYAAVEDLAKKGLIKGYPPDGRFLGGRTLTRYEMATIIKRILDRMDDLVKQAKPGVTQEDFDKLKASVGEIRQLVEEFKTQLTIIGTDMTQVKSDLEALKAQVGALTGRVDALDTRVSGLSAKVDEATVLADQALANIEELKNSTNAALAKKVDVGVGKLRLSGLLQAWYGNPFGNTLNGNLPTNFSAAPGGRSFGGGVGDTFRLRRGEIALVGNITKDVDYRVMLDVAKTSSNVGNPANSVLQDLWVGYALAPRWRVEVGQQKTGLSEEGTRSSSQLLTVERSIMNGLPANYGRIGDIRDTGALVRYSGALANGLIGIWNDNGVAQNGTGDDRFKFLDFNLYFTGLRHVSLGVWGGTKIGDFRPRNLRDRAGATVKLDYGRHSAEAEFAIADDRSTTGVAPLATTGLRSRSMGGYALYAYMLSPQWQFVGRYDEWDPSIHGGLVNGVVLTRGNHNLKEYTIGANYYFRSHSAKIQVNYIIDDTQRGGYAFFGTRRQVLLGNYQVAF
jgi:polyhydroxyalkanoate synthesis regulator phasin